MATKTIKTESTPRGLQKAFVASVVVAYLLQTGFTLYNVLSQLPANQNLSAYYVTVGQLILTPLVFTLFAWVINPRTLTKLGRAFESLIIAAVGMMLIMIVGEIMTMFPINMDTPMLWMVTPVVVAVAYLGALVFARVSKLWK